MVNSEQSTKGKDKEKERLSWQEMISERPGINSIEIEILLFFPDRHRNGDSKELPITRNGGIGNNSFLVLSFI